MLGNQICQRPGKQMCKKAITGSTAVKDKEERLSCTERHFNIRPAEYGLRNDHEIRKPNMGWSTSMFLGWSIIFCCSMVQLLGIPVSLPKTCNSCNMSITKGIIKGITGFFFLCPFCNLCRTYRAELRLDKTYRLRTQLRSVLGV